MGRHDDEFTDVNIHDYSPEARAAIRSRNDYVTYPLGFSQTVGNIQANRAPDCYMNNVVDEINLACNDDPDIRTVTIGKSQFYNEASHNFRATAEMHDVTRSFITASAIGKGVSSDSNKTKANKLVPTTEPLLPHQRFQDKADNVGNNIGIRLELNKTVHLKHLARENRNGE
jgi:hypothetical protein